MTHFRGFQTAIRGNLLARKIVSQSIALGIRDNVSFYAPEQCTHSARNHESCRVSQYCVPGASVNDTQFPNDFNYINPPVLVTENDHSDATSQRFHVRNQFCVSTRCFDGRLDLGRLFIFCSRPKPTSVRSE